MPEGVVEKRPDRAAVWTFQEAEAVSDSEVDSFNSRAEILYIGQSNTFILYYTTLLVIPS
jgi:hypothetical protein